MEIKEYKDYVRSFRFEGNVDRTNNRKNYTQEYFTPSPLVKEMLDKIEKSKPDIFSDETKTIIDNACGDGQFLTEVVIRKIERSSCTLEQALSTTYGVELIGQNVIMCRKRLAGLNPTQNIINIVDRNIIKGNAFEFNYDFDNPIFFTNGSKNTSLM